MVDDCIWDLPRTPLGGAFLDLLALGGYTCIEGHCRFVRDATICSSLGVASPSVKLDREPAK